jgi:arylsulfatase A-like enzyme
MSGLYPHVKGHRTMNHLMRYGEDTLLKELKDSGYDVWMNDRGDLLAGQDRELLMQHTNVLYTDRGKHNEDEGRGEPKSDTYFSFYRGIIKTDENEIEEDSDVVYTRAAVDYIKNRPANKPFCLFLAFTLPHPPYRIEQKYLDFIDPSILPKRIPTFGPEAGKPAMLQGLRDRLGVAAWKENRFDKLRSVYLAMCAKVDDLTGQVIRTLKDEKIWDNTALFFFSDHGDYTGDYGVVEKSQNTFEDCLVRVPLIIKPPAGVSVDPGTSIAMTELIDFYATALDVGGIKSSHTHFGKSLMPILNDRNTLNRDFVTCEGGRLLEEIHYTGNNSDNFLSKINDEYVPRNSLQAEETGVHTKATMIRTADYKYTKRLYEEDEFYDLRSDPEETVNRIHDPGYKQKILELKEKMLEWYQATCDIVPFDSDQRFSDQFLVKVATAGNIPDQVKKFLIHEVMEKGRPFNEVIKEAFSKQA